MSDRNRTTIVATLFAAGSLIVAGTAAAGALQQTAPHPRPAKTSNIPVPPGDGMDLAKKKCVGCHGTDVWTSQRHTKDQWNGILDNMVSKGMEASDDELDKLATYLSTNLGPDSPPPAAPGTTAPQGTTPAPTTGTPPSH